MSETTGDELMRRIAGFTGTLELEIDGEAEHWVLDGNSRKHHPGPAEAPDLIVEMSAGALARLLKAPETMLEAIADGEVTISGDASKLAQLQRALSEA
jgi:putative sterol carrier protein